MAEKAPSARTEESTGSNRRSQPESGFSRRHAAQHHTVSACPHHLNAPRSRDSAGGILALQRTIGNRAVKRLLQTRRASEDEPLQIKQGVRTGSAEVIQPKLGFEGAVYGQGEEKTLSDKRLANGRRLPGWSTEQMTSADQFYVLNATQTEWVADQRVVFFGFTREGEKIAKKTGTHGPVEAIRDEATGSRLGPKHPKERTVSRATLVKSVFEGSNANGWHWVLECEVEGGKKGGKMMTMDLMPPSGHRIYYGTADQVVRRVDGNSYEELDFTLASPKSVTEVYEAMQAVAKEEGAWTGLAGHNCQDFVLAMLRKLEVSEQASDDLFDLGAWRFDQRMSAILEHEIGPEFHQNQIGLGGL